MALIWHCDIFSVFLLMQGNNCAEYMFKFQLCCTLLRYSMFTAEREEDLRYRYGDREICDFFFGVFFFPETATTQRRNVVRLYTHTHTHTH